MRKDDPQIKIRVPPALRAELEAAAKKSKRSMNAEILERLYGVGVVPLMLDKLLVLSIIRDLVVATKPLFKIKGQPHAAPNEITIVTKKVGEILKLPELQDGYMSGELKRLAGLVAEIESSKARDLRPSVASEDD